MPLISARGDDWTVCQGGWLIIDGAEGLTNRDLRGLSSAMAAGTWGGMNPDGESFGIPIPRDFRIVLVGSPSEALRASGIPAIKVGPGGGDGALRRLFLADAAHWLGPADDEADLRYRGGIADCYAEIASFIRVLAPVSQGALRTACTYSIARGGDIEGAVQDGFATHLASRIGDTTAGQSVIAAVSQGTLSALIGGVAKDVKKGRTDTAARLAAWLDEADDGPRGAAFAEAVELDDKISIVKGWKADASGPLPSIFGALAGLLAVEST